MGCRYHKKNPSVHYIDNSYNSRRSQEKIARGDHGLLLRFSQVMENRKDTLKPRRAQNIWVTGKDYFSLPLSVQKSPAVWYHRRKDGGTIFRGNRNMG
jgi:hypothetical protein